MGYSGVVELIREALNLARDTDREIVALVYGFEGLRRSTGEIAQQRGMSPQNVDEIAISVVRRMRHPTAAALIRKALAAADATVWSALSGSADVVRKAESM